jgi:hypothetical protein
MLPRIGCLWASEALGWGTLFTYFTFITLPLYHLIPEPTLTHLFSPYTQRVAVAARSVIGTSLNITHQALVMGVDLLDLAPVPGLRAAAVTLLNVWDALQKVDVRIFSFSIFSFLLSF